MKKHLLLFVLAAFSLSMVAATQTATWRTQDWASGETTVTETSLPGLGGNNMVTQNGVTFVSDMTLIMEANLNGNWWGWTAFRAIEGSSIDLTAADGWCIKEVSVSCMAYDATNPAAFKIDFYDAAEEGVVLAGGTFDLTPSAVGAETPCSITSVPAGAHFAKIYNVTTNNTWQHWIFAITVVIEEEEAPVGPITPYLAFNDATYYLGTADLNLATLHGDYPMGSISYTVKEANGTGAAISGFYFSATSAGTATVTATQAAVPGKYNEVSVDATITIAAPSPAATSIDFAELAASAPDIATTLANSNYMMSSLNSVSWDSQGSDAPDTGLKTESGNKDFSFFVGANSEVTITLGNWQGDSNQQKSHTAELYANGVKVADLAANTANGPYATTGLTRFVIKIVDPFWSVLKKIDIVAPEDPAALPVLQSDASVRKVLRGNRLYILRNHELTDILGF